MKATEETLLPCPRCEQPMGRLCTADGVRGWSCGNCDLRELVPNFPREYLTVTNTRLRSPLAARTWQQALELLVCDGTCPWCGNRLLNVSLVHQQLRWGCLEGCNP